MSFVDRVAGKALFDFLKVAAKDVASTTSKAVLPYLSSASEAVDFPGVMGSVAKGVAKIGPERLAGYIGMAAPIAASAGVAAGSAALGNMFNPSGGIYSGSDYSLPVQQQAAMGRAPAFAGQRYMPGSSPLTNEQMGESLLEQQKFQHQLQLIQSRNSAQSYGGSLSPGVLSGGSGVGDIMNQMQQTLNTSTIYK